MLLDRSLEGIPASWYLKCMSHTCAGNISILFQARGPFIASCTACVSGSQGIGLGYEAIKSGKGRHYDHRRSRRGGLSVGRGL